MGAFCKKCGNYVFEPCKCKSFKVIDDDGEEREIYANHEEAAALEFARLYNENGDYALMNDTIEITVDGNKYCVGAEPDIYYSSTKL